MSFINPIKTEELTERELFKAACCNLSESFETNPSVDVSFTDAISGTKQIRMLGLSGPYTLISRENMPGIRGIDQLFGMAFIPGSWISSIQLSKGVGSVVNGYESIAGQINVELKKAEEHTPLFINVYANQGGRTEVNLVHSAPISEHWSYGLLMHGNNRPFEMDRNNDGFMDFPTKQQINLLNRWKYDNHNGILGQISLHYVTDDHKGGQTEDQINVQKEQLNFRPYLLEVESERIELATKTAYVFPDLRYKNIALQTAFRYQNQQSTIGPRNYQANERYAYTNLIYQSIIGNSNHTFKSGLTFSHDAINEQLDSLSFDRHENVAGTFFEYTGKYGANFTLIAGLRADYHNLFHTLITPRIHMRWAVNEKNVVRGAVGSGRRTAHVLTERQSLLATSRNIQFLGDQSRLPYGMNMEYAWSFGLNWTKEFTLDYREGYWSIDVYRTEFSEQVVVDLDEGSDHALIGNLEGQSFSNSLQMEVSYELIKFLDLRMAYRWNEVMTNYRSGLRLQPLIPKQRWFMNLAYQTQKTLEGAFWSIDQTLVWTGVQRLPLTADNPADLQRAPTSEEFYQLNAQLSRTFNKQWTAYIGVENALDFRQNNPIVDAANPFSENFDASRVWGPIFGRMLYVGFRFTLPKD